MNDKFSNDKSEFIERLVGVRRVAKTTKGGRTMSFAALVVVGDGNGKVGVGYGKAKEVPIAVTKASQVARKTFFDVPRIQGTVPHPVQGEASAGVVFLRPASPGTGVIAGGPVRAVLECAGYTDVLTKSLGSSNSINIVHATVAALKKLERPESVAKRRGLPLEDVAPAQMLAAQAAGVKASESEVQKQTNIPKAKKTQAAKDREKLAKETAPKADAPTADVDAKPEVKADADVKDAEVKETPKPAAEAAPKPEAKTAEVKEDAPKAEVKPDEKGDK
jgi:small subunit ribosomal protein S5